MTPEPIYGTEKCLYCKAVDMEQVPSAHPDDKDFRCRKCGSRYHKSQGQVGWTRGPAVTPRCKDCNDSMEHMPSNDSDSRYFKCQKCGIRLEIWQDKEFWSDSKFWNEESTTEWFQRIMNG